MALVVAAIIALHRLRRRPVTRVVSSLLIWERALKQTGKSRSSWRWWLSLALCLLIGVLLTIVLTRPDIQGFGDTTKRVLVVVDNGPSMAVATRDNQTRWEHARATARRVIRDAPGPVMVMDSMGHASPMGFTGRNDALTVLDRLSVVPAGEATFPPVPDFPDLELHVVSDGIGRFAIPAGANIHSVFEPAVNVAVTRLVARPLPGKPLRVEAFVQIFNASPNAMSVRLSLRGGASYSLSQNLHMAAGELLDATFDVSDFEGGVLAAGAFAQGDALAADDIAYTVVEPHRIQHVLLVTQGNQALSDALAALPAVRVETVDPAHYQPFRNVDAYVFDGFTPAEPPPAGALLFLPDPRNWIQMRTRRAGQIAIRDWDRANAVSAGVPWDTLSIRRAILWTQLTPDVEAIVRTDSGALVIASDGSPPWIATGFRSEDSDFPLQPGFPAFLGNALAHLTGRNELITAQLGQIRLPMADADVVDGHGKRVDSRHVMGGTIFEATRPDIYTARSGGRRLQVAAAVLDPVLADVNRSRFPIPGSDAAGSFTLPLERWAVILIACLVLLLFDWTAFARRISR
jgi:hypothetical protein